MSLVWGRAGCPPVAPPEVDLDQPSTSSASQDSRSDRTSAQRRRGRNDWSFSPDKDTDWAMSSASGSDDEPGRPTRISTRSSTSTSILEGDSSAASPKNEEESTPTGDIDFSIGEPSQQPTLDRPPCPDSLGPICLVPCAVKDFTVDPTPLEQRIQHQRMQQDMAQRLASSPGSSQVLCSSRSRFLGPTRWIETTPSPGGHLSISYVPDHTTPSLRDLSDSDGSVRSRSPVHGSSRSAPDALKD